MIKTWWNRWWYVKRTESHYKIHIHLNCWHCNLIRNLILSGHRLIPHQKEGDFYPRVYNPGSKYPGPDVRKKFHQAEKGLSSIHHSHFFWWYYTLGFILYTTADIPTGALHWKYQSLSWLWRDNKVYLVILWSFQAKMIGQIHLNPSIQYWKFFLCFLPWSHFCKDLKTKILVKLSRYLSQIRNHHIMSRQHIRKEISSSINCLPWYFPCLLYVPLPRQILTASALLVGSPCLLPKQIWE